MFGGGNEKMAGGGVETLEAGMVFGERGVPGSTGKKRLWLR
jgi:hypothetical protein